MSDTDDPLLTRGVYALAAVLALLNLIGTPPTATTTAGLVGALLGTVVGSILFALLLKVAFQKIRLVVGRLKGLRA